MTFYQHGGGRKVRILWCVLRFVSVRFHAFYSTMLYNIETDTNAFIPNNIFKAKDVPKVLIGKRREWESAGNSRKIMCRKTWMISSVICCSVLLFSVHSSMARRKWLHKAFFSTAQKMNIQFLEKSDKNEFPEDLQNIRENTRPRPGAKMNELLPCSLYLLPDVRMFKN